MAKTTPLINNFNGGELSSKLDTRSDINKYFSGCRTLQNMVPLVEGGAQKMPGTLFVAKARPFMPQNAYLIGWYKVDEGSGVTLVNSAEPVAPATKLPDITLGAASDYFWEHLSGFGSGGGSTGLITASYYNATSFYQTTVDDSIGCFWRMDGLDSNSYPFLFDMAINDQFNQETELSIGTSSTGGRVDVGCFMNGESHGAFTAASPVLLYSTYVNRWMFTFAITESGAWKLKTVLDDGTLLTGAQTNAIGTQVGRAVRWIRLFYGWNGSKAAYQYLFGQAADAMYWTGKQLTLSEWAQVYDYRRVRYGMAARSGW